MYFLGGRLAYGLLVARNFPNKWMYLKTKPLDYFGLDKVYNLKSEFPLSSSYMSNDKNLDWGKKIPK